MLLSNHNMYMIQGRPFTALCITNLMGFSGVLTSLNI